MILDLQPDIFYNIIYFLFSINDLITLSEVNKYMNKLIDDSYYLHMANILKGHEFWIKAKNRPIERSKPLKNMKLELLRLDSFKRKLNQLGVDEWSNDEFYQFWNMSDNKYEKYCITKINTLKL